MNLKIENVPTESIKPYKNNAKLHPSEQVEQIKRSIEEFGFNDPLAVWHGTVVEGHGRLIAAQELGMETEPVIRLDELSDEQRRAYTLIHNKLTMNSGFDVDLLNIELDDITVINMADFGFDLDLNDEDVEVVEDEAPEEVETRCKLGDLWQLGSHRLICGDSTDVAVIDRLMDGVKADIAITSPPYGESKSAGIRHHYEKGKARINSLYESHDDNIANWFELIQGSFQTMKSATKAQFINIQMLADNKRDMLRFLNENKDCFVDVIIWDKKKAPPQMESNILNNAFEFVFCFCDEGASRKIPFGDFHGNISNIIELSTGHNEYADIHKAVYPVEFPSKIMNIASKARSVLDVFGGTGTTLIACEQLNRKCYMAELDPKYVSVILQRYINFKGSDEDVFLLKDGKKIPYSEVE